MPGFDFKKERSRKEMNSIRRIIDVKIDRERKEKGENFRLSSVKEKALAPGMKVNIKGEKSPMTIKSIGKSGYIQFVERRGSFNPTWAEPTK